MAVTEISMPTLIKNHFYGMGDGFGNFAGTGREIIVDNFAGGGGASTGIEMATGRSVDIAINHDPDAIAMHKANHPDTEHYCESVWDVDPVKAVRGRPVGFAWFSPDCKHFSKAKGGKPVEKAIRGLAWIVLRWCALVHVRSFGFENVEEFRDWGPVDEEGQPIKERKGETFEAFKACLTTGLHPSHPAWGEIREVLGPDFPYEKLEQGLGYDVEFREMRACDHGAPTTRKRLYGFGRNDGKKIVWPKPTHGDPNSIEVQNGKLKPWRTAAEIIDWSIPTPSIFDRKKPLAENTLKRIGRGIKKFVLENPNPFIVTVNHKGEGFRGQGIDQPIQTITAKNGMGIVTTEAVNVDDLLYSFIAQVYGTSIGHSLYNPLATVTSKQKSQLVTPVITRMFGQSTGHPVTSPLGTVTSGGGGKSQLTTPILMKYFNTGEGQNIQDPLHTVTTKDRFSLLIPHITKFRGGSTGHLINEPLHTITSGAGSVRPAGAPHAMGMVAPFLTKYHGDSIGNEARGQAMDKPIKTLDTSNRFSLASMIVKHYGGNYSGAGIGMDEPLDAITTKDHHALAASNLVKFRGTNTGHKTDEPLHTISAQGLHLGEVRTILVRAMAENPKFIQVLEFFRKYVGEDILPIVYINGEVWVFSDICMRMLEPKELFAAMGFRPNYIIDRDHLGNPYPKYAQVARCGNAVSPVMSERITRANLPELCVVPFAGDYTSASNFKISQMSMFDTDLAMAHG